MAKLSNTAIPKEYAKFRKAVINGEIPVNQYIAMQMNRIDERIKDPDIYYDEDAINGYIDFCNDELTLTDGTDLHLLDSFKLWAEDLYAWYYLSEKEVYVPNKNGRGGKYVTKKVKTRLTKKQYLIVGRGAAKSMYGSTIQDFELNVNPMTTHQITVAPTMRQADEVMSPIRTAITRARGPLFKFFTFGSINNTTGSKENRVKLASTKKGIENFYTGSLLEIRPMNIDKLQGLRVQVATIDEWLSGDVREDVIGAIEQGASKNNDYIIIAMSSEGTVRNGVGDTIKMELLDILKGKYAAPHVSIWYYRLDDLDEINDPEMWIKANPNIGKTVKREVYQMEVERAEANPAARNDIIAKRFNIPMEGCTYFFTYEETLKSRRVRNYKGMACSMGADLSQGDDFCAFTFLFPLPNGKFGIKARSYISSLTYNNLHRAAKEKYNEFINEGSLVVLEGSYLEMDEVYQDLDEHILEMEYDVESMGYDPYNATDFVKNWVTDNGPYGVEKVKQGKQTETVPLGEIKKLAYDEMLVFDQEIMTFTMGNCIVEEDTNGNRKLLKKRYADKIDNVSALMDAFVAFKLNKESFG
jgi:phage terminase large subunit-like protein